MMTLATDYEQLRNAHVEENRKRLQALGLVDILHPLSSTPLLEDNKQARKKSKVLVDYNPKAPLDNATHVNQELWAYMRALGIEERGMFSTDGLQRRLAQLEKSRAHRRKLALMGKGKTRFKKPRLSKGAQGRGGHLNAGPADRGHYGVANAPPYTLSGQALYDRRPQGGYSSVYGADARSPGSISNSNLYCSDVLSGSAYPAAAGSTYSDLSVGYSAYPYGHEIVTQTSSPSSYLR
ncbi:hypothetical protein L7F22_004458 [Adiantum nelumboides]|nr:hypothetical protein [Adiantum nelumboides]